jgi:hypothetical protein
VREDEVRLQPQALGKVEREREREIRDLLASSNGYLRIDCRGEREREQGAGTSRDMKVAGSGETLTI